jgi:hypothetical protein
VLTGETFRNVEETLARTELLYCKSSLLRKLLRVAFGHRDLQNLPRKTSMEIYQTGVYSNNPRSLEELKHNTEYTAANTDQETLRKAA